MKPRARYTPRLDSWAFWVTGNDWATRMVGFGWSLEQAIEDWIGRRTATRSNA